MRTGSGKRERGAAAVEFALVAVLLITLVVGAVEFGRAWAMQASLASAARDAARELAVKRATADPQAVLNTVFPFGTATIVNRVNCPVPADPTVNSSARLTAEFKTSTLTGLMPFGAITLRGEGVMRCGG